MNEVRADQTLLGKRIKEEREYRGLSREEVGHCLDVPRSVISLIETGSRPVSAEELNRLCKLYQIKKESLTDCGSGDDAPDPELDRLFVRATAELSPTDREEVMRFARFLRARESIE